MLRKPHDFSSADPCAYRRILALSELELMAMLWSWRYVIKSLRRTRRHLPTKRLCWVVLFGGVVRELIVGATDFRNWLTYFWPLTTARRCPCVLWQSRRCWSITQRTAPRPYAARDPAISSSADAASADSRKAGDV